MDFNNETTELMTQGAYRKLLGLFHKSQIR
jgi:hypothetical protein